MRLEIKIVKKAPINYFFSSHCDIYFDLEKCKSESTLCKQLLKFIWECGISFLCWGLQKWQKNALDVALIAPIALIAKISFNALIAQIAHIVLTVPNSLITLTTLISLITAIALINFGLLCSCYVLPMLLLCCCYVVAMLLLLFISIGTHSADILKVDILARAELYFCKKMHKNTQIVTYLVLRNAQEI